MIDKKENTFEKIYKLPLDDETWSYLLQKFKDSHPQSEVYLSNLSRSESDSDLNHLSTRVLTDISVYESNDILLFSTFPKKPLFVNGMVLEDKVKLVQNFLNRLQYNHLGVYFFDVKTKRPVYRLAELAKDIIRNPMPIKCLEAVIVSIFLTSSIESLLRFSIRFKSRFQNKVHRHIVLGLYWCSQSCFGAIGLSRRSNLMDKPFKYKKLSDLIFDYRASYSECYHCLTKVKLSSIITSNMQSSDQINWNYYAVPMLKTNDENIVKSLEMYSRELRKSSYIKH
ncbi:tubulinyl-Tyr carboxypeptidase 1 [Hydra vulgaris]|uniref:tubulinyl-Tyr carboxypeptidase 1 n=1 Tax=Hydra vulgaris TaxID=6087 RepID=UPI0001925195|nr:tubulinyl-Tyr carboxypeptidase 1-like [Hydra vulgaris]